MPEDYWVDGVAFERETPEEREARIKAQKEAKLEKKRRKPGEIPKYVKGRKEGMNLEKKIAKKWNDSFGGKKEDKKYNVKQRQSFLDEEPEKIEEPVSDIPSTFSAKTPKRLVKHKSTAGQEARRQPNSGAMWYAKGDITLDHALMEVKERGTVNGRGEKTISIPKEWLTKQEDEAFQERRDFWYLAFAYKNDDEVYLIKSYDHEIEMVKELRRLQAENEELKEKLDN